LRVKYKKNSVVEYKIKVIIDTSDKYAFLFAASHLTNMD